MFDPNGCLSQVLSSSHPDDLNYMLLHINCAALLEVADAAVMPLLVSQQRLRHLSALSRCLPWPSILWLCTVKVRIFHPWQCTIRMLCRQKHMLALLSDTMPWFCL